MEAFAYDRPAFWLAVFKLIWIDLLLSGDNAVVIAMACRSLPPIHRRIGTIAGATAAVGLRIVFASVVAILMHLPYLHAVGAALLLWIAVDLVGPEPKHEQATAAARNLWHAIRIIVVADAVMSLDNVVAIAAAAHGSIVLIALGLALSIPLVVAGSQLVMRLIEWSPLVIWAGAALLGWVSGELLGDEVVLQTWFATWPLFADFGLPAICALAVVVVGLLLRRRRRRPPASIA
ncbi:TerC family protein [Siculibacillus lacustris]|uniref:TerC family protein n=1 Tax=Siculibacillus lacustris TaxID=1549641 RepID=A0A4Q9VX17_9HYPH|nr:TerC family protein [Siculibacillus lacustris]TBW40923.1 TerC family protein [Siculibacillus lacustris]